MNFRKTYKFKGGKKGKPVLFQFKNLKKGHYFYLESPDGNILVDNKGYVVFRALTDAKRYKHICKGNYVLKTKGIA